MSTFTLFSGHSSTSVDTFSEKSLCLEKLVGCDAKPSRLTFHTTRPALSAPLRKQPSAFAKLSRCLRSVVSALKSMGCNRRTCGSRSSVSNTRHISKLFPIPNSDDRIFQKPASSVDVDRLSLANASISIRTAHEVFLDMPYPGLVVSPLGDCTHTPAPSSNLAYKECHLLDDESLRFVTAFLPTMEPLAVWSLPNSAEALNPDVEREAPTANWIRRNTCIRPGHVIQIPSVHDKDISYFLSCESNTTPWPRADNSLMSMEQSPRPKLFVAQNDGAESWGGVDGYPRAFIMCNPVWEDQH